MRRVAFLVMLVTLALPLVFSSAAQADVLYDQTDNPSALVIGSTDYTSRSIASLAADDFTVPAGQSWTISEVAVGGFYASAGTSSSVNVFIYADAGGVPGTELYSTTVSPSDGGSSPNLVLAISGAPALAAGHYWLGVQAIFPSGDPNHDGWWWQARTVQSGDPAVWRNPDNSFGTGCTSFTVRSTCLSGTESPDQIFKLSGTSVPVGSDFASLIADSQGVGPGTSLVDKARRAQSEYEDGDVAQACQVLSAYIREVTAQTDKGISPSQAADLIDEAREIRTAIGC